MIPAGHSGGATMLGGDQRSGGGQAGKSGAGMQGAKPSYQTGNYWPPS